ncbi:lipoyl(octanoyl) transferase LipB [Oxalobacter aliiformigenes]|uniref:Octanoyltransferase n=1 Tax=Oxalobacter aliiformigenes TaxID=2946593 RepID=A0A9E9NRR0_9BURK|nr:lipoyl(octanoyl) transferase LipB [Oxalobacter aliiformigenes]WAV89429.1 lipoyl(octanoyl) transferase LipB [Oxalobacter aliiformigenes]WAV91436.1 lipoyl(octanoyl) transferase LipB [Oxalobacter aliiformigenes]
MQTDTIWMRRFGRVQYEPVFHKMIEFARRRSSATPDEIWIVEHDPVFTLGQAADKTHVLDPHGIPVYETDRGGEVTYHGPGQLVVYLLIDLKRRFSKLPVRELVFKIEGAIIRTLSAFDIVGERRTGAPGVYLPAGPVYGNNQGAKIAALGLKIKNNGCMYHGFALNVAMNLEPFKWIDPCGYKGLAVTDMRSAGYSGSLDDVQQSLIESLSSEMGFRIRPGDNGETVHGD